MHWSVSKKDKSTARLDDAKLADEASSLSPLNGTSSIHFPPPQMTCSATHASPAYQTEDNYASHVNPQPSTHPASLNADVDVDPPSYSAIYAPDSPITSDEERPSPTPGKKQAGKATKHFRSLKSAVEDGRASSFAKAACSGGMRAQACFLKAEAVTQAVKTGNVPLVAFNVARAAYKGGKQASQTWKEAEKEREKKLVKEGKMMEACEDVEAEGEVGEKGEAGVRKRVSTRVEARKEGGKNKEPRGCERGSVNWGARLRCAKMVFGLVMDSEIWWWSKRAAEDYFAEVVSWDGRVWVWASSRPSSRFPNRGTVRSV